MARSINLGPVLLIAGMLLFGGYAKTAKHGAAGDPNAPRGALEYFSSEDGKMHVTLYKDRIVAENFKSLTGWGEMTSPFVIYLSNIKTIHRRNRMVEIYCYDRAQLMFDLGLFGRGDEERFVETVKSMISPDRPS